jgi:hypothetical protein
MDGGYGCGTPSCDVHTYEWCRTTQKPADRYPMCGAWNKKTGRVLQRCARFAPYDRRRGGVTVKMVCDMGASEMVSN